MSMIRRTILVSTIAASLALAACGSGEPDEAEPAGEAISVQDAVTAMGDAVEPRPGQYETKVEILEFSMTGMPSGQAERMQRMMSGRTDSSFCLTPEEAEEGPQRMVQELANSDCVFDSFDIDGGTLHAEMQCSGEGGMEGSYVLDGEMEAESSAVTMQIDQAIPGMPGNARVEIGMRVTSRRVGDCA